MVLLVTLSRCPRFCLERCHNAVPPPVGGLLPGRGSRALSFVRDTAASPATTLRLTPQRVLAAAARRSCGEQTAPMVLLMTLPRCPRFCLERCHNAVPPPVGGLLPGRGSRALSFVRNTAASPATTLRLTPQRVLAAAARRSCGEQTAPMVLLVTLSRCPRFCLERCHNAVSTAGRRAPARAWKSRSEFCSQHCRVARNYVAIDTTARFGCGGSPLLRRADRAYGFVGDTVAMPALLPRTMPQRDIPPPVGGP